MPARLDAASLRLDYYHSPRVTMFARYNHAPSSFTIPEEWNAASQLRNTGRTRTITGGLDAELAPRLYNELRLNYSNDARVESTTIAALSSLLGFVVYGAIVLAAAIIVKQQTGVVLDPLKFHPVIVAAPAGMIVLGAIAGIVPAFKAYSTDVAANLVATS